MKCMSVIIAAMATLQTKSNSSGCQERAQKPVLTKAVFREAHKPVVRACTMCGTHYHINNVNGKAANIEME